MKNLHFLLKNFLKVKKNIIMTIFSLCKNYKMHLIAYFNLSVYVCEAHS